MKTKLLILLTVSMLILAGCNFAAPTTSPQPTDTPSGNPGDISFDFSPVAQNVSLENVAAVPATEGGPFWEGTPQYRRLTLQGYPVTGNAFQPQIYVYAVADLAPANEAMAKYAADLQALLQTRQAGNQLPFLPLSNLAQLVRARMEFVNFKSGQGVQFLTQLSQGIGPINNSELIFAFQGLTSDGKYYIAAILPVTHPELPADAAGAQQSLEDYSAYRSSIIDWLDTQPAGSFTPSLDALSAMIRSIEVK